MSKDGNGNGDRSGAWLLGLFFVSLTLLGFGSDIWNGKSPARLTAEQAIVAGNGSTNPGPARARVFYLCNLTMLEIKRWADEGDHECQEWLRRLCERIR